MKDTVNIENADVKKTSTEDYQDKLVHATSCFGDHSQKAKALR